MGKRSNFERMERDFYPTLLEAVHPLIPHLQGVETFHEPCVGDGALIYELKNFDLFCVEAYDIAPQVPWIKEEDALTYRPEYLADCFITNPPWMRDILHPLIAPLSNIAPTWLLFDADWMHTRQAAPYLVRCRKIVSVGRVKWIPGSKHTGKDNCAWYLFDSKGYARGTQFYGRGNDGSGG